MLQHIPSWWAFSAFQDNHTLPSVVVVVVVMGQFSSCFSPGILSYLSEVILNWAGGQLGRIFLAIAWLL